MWFVCRKGVWFSSFLLLLPKVVLRRITVKASLQSVLAFLLESAGARLKFLPFVVVNTRGFSKIFIDGLFPPSAWFAWRRLLFGFSIKYIMCHGGFWIPSFRKFAAIWSGKAGKRGFFESHIPENHTRKEIDRAKKSERGKSEISWRMTFSLNMITVLLR